MKQLYKKYDALQKIYGDPSLHSIYNGGEENHPDVLFIFMNPTGRNVASLPGWHGIRAPWIGSKNIWKLFYQLGLLEEEIYLEIQKKKPKEWTEEIAFIVYENVKKHHYFITNLGKCTQIDARPLPNYIYEQYLELLLEEIYLLNPKKIICFGNQISSILLKQPITVSTCRRKEFTLKIKKKRYPCYPTYYPIGNGMRNIDKAIIDIQSILKK